jgi:anti-sigma factor RsiW
VSDIDIHHLSAAYALDALDARERAAFEAHYPSCDVCRADVLDFRSTLAVVAEAEAVAPPADLRRRRPPWPPRSRPVCSRPGR